MNQLTETDKEIIKYIGSANKPSGLDVASHFGWSADFTLTKLLCLVLKGELVRYPGTGGYYEVVER
jgi:hypothetical protein